MDFSFDFPIYYELTRLFLGKISIMSMGSFGGKLHSETLVETIKLFHISLEGTTVEKLSGQHMPCSAIFKGIGSHKAFHFIFSEIILLKYHLIFDVSDDFSLPP